MNEYLLVYELLPWAQVKSSVKFLEKLVKRIYDILGQSWTPTHLLLMDAVQAQHLWSTSTISDINISKVTSTDSDIIIIVRWLAPVQTLQ